MILKAVKDEADQGQAHKKKHVQYCNGASCPNGKVVSKLLKLVLPCNENSLSLLAGVRVVHEDRT